jgi:hypothetical protein
MKVLRGDNMTVEDLITAYNCCFRIHELGCSSCPLKEIGTKDTNCEKVLAELTIEKLRLMKDLLDDTVNHHYYDTLEFYQEENNVLRAKLEAIKELIQ